MVSSPASAFARSRVPPWLRGSSRVIPAGFAPRFLALAWPEVLAVVVSAGTAVDGQAFPAGSVVVIDEHPAHRLWGRAPPNTPAAVVEFAKRNRLPPAGFSAAAVPPALADRVHVAVVDVPRQAAAELAAAMLAAAGTARPALYVSARCERFWEAPRVTYALALACWVARRHLAPPC